MKFLAKTLIISAHFALLALCLPDVQNEYSFLARQKRQPNFRLANDVFNEKRNRILDRFRWGQLRQVNVNAPRAVSYIGHGGRVEMVQATITPRNLRQGTATTLAMRNHARNLGGPNDQAGHVIARNLGGTGSQAWNIFPQNANFNQGVWAQQEADVYNIVNRGNPVQYTVLLEYPNNQATRPTRVWYQRQYTDRRTGQAHSETGDVLNP